MENVKQWEYKVIKKIGKGEYGEVYRCRHRKTKEWVAIKMLTITNIVEGVPSQIIRGISLLRTLDHVNIIRLLDVLTSGNYVYLVFEYLDLDLHSFIAKATTTMKTLMIKAILKQIFISVAYCHALEILNRDIKPTNILIDLKSNIVKIADFGLSRAFGIPLKEHSSQMAFSLYTAPELLLGSRLYSTPTDVWAVGCIFGEMLTREPLFPHDNQLRAIRRFTGEVRQQPRVPQDCRTAELQLVRRLKGEVNVMLDDPCINALNKLAKMLETFPDLGRAGIDLTSSMLTYNPRERVTINNALKHEYLNDVEIVALTPPPRTSLFSAFQCFRLITKSKKAPQVNRLNSFDTMPTVRNLKTFAYIVLLIG
ncbi:cell division control protein 2 homolog [Pistacia vera]|uniref:cell division control protein 2 homolog n=1 Tax=Pistacia vera TaxID=55513 RepID=UPI00126361A3|nr:cell division control protein 2 homolog [Pistacia vera]